MNCKLLLSRKTIKCRIQNSGQRNMQICFSSSWLYPALNFHVKMLIRYTAYTYSGLNKVKSQLCQLQRYETPNYKQAFIRVCRYRYHYHGFEQIHQLHVRLSNTGFSNPYVQVNKLMGFSAPLTDLFDSDATRMSFPELVEMKFTAIMPFQIKHL